MPLLNKKSKNKLGGTAFLVGLAIAFILATISSLVIEYAAMLQFVVVVTAILVGLLNVKKAEGQKFALYIIALILLGTGMGAFAAFADVGLQIVTNVISGIANYFLAVGAIGILAGLYKIYKS